MRETKFFGSVEDILLSHEFEQYIKGDLIYEEFWTNFENASEENKSLLATAKEIHNILINHKRVVYSEEQKDRDVKRLMTMINALEQPKSHNIFHFNNNIYYKIASAVLFIITMTGLFYLYTKTGSFNVPGNAFHEISVPSGEKSTVTLSDGTKVWLNSESKLKYYSNYGIDKRELYLVGEGYFDVAKNENLVFVVHTQNINIQALGTKFNVKSYPDDPTIETTLIEGKVLIEDNLKESRFEKIYLDPSEKITFRKSLNHYERKKEPSERSEPLKITESLTIKKVDVKNVISWKDYSLVFENETFEEIAVKMSRWFKVEVLLVGDELKKQRYTGKFINDESIEQVLEVIKITTPIEYIFYGNKVEIKLKEGGKMR